MGFPGTIRLTLKGAHVFERMSRMRERRSLEVIYPAPIEPKQPSFETATMSDDPVIPPAIGA